MARRKRTHGKCTKYGFTRGRRKVCRRFAKVR